ncbi:hypothetical protein BKA70DRAFT_552559 [Coprinopsis sp. MPI-PUGE-AT-0042]|nr:hypothetical protein BKA70DRAFT_552559 [Coprinopsis sp. MPI-PUGE-AT-0042]
MLATPTSRPRPPAKRRQRTASSIALEASTNEAPSERRRLDSITTTSSSSPPPAYASSVGLMSDASPNNELIVMPNEFPETLLGSPVPSSFRFAPLEPMPGQEWIDEKSREELAELLVKAEDIIKERENELGMAATIAKTLYESNINLKTKHEAFIKRLPLSATSSPQHSRHQSYHYPPFASPGPVSAISRSTSLSSTHSQHSVHVYEASPSPSPSASPSPAAAPPFYRRHARQVSMSTGEISLLADQNAELMDKLQQLESESSSADQAGRRELKRLENEISSLREALEKTQAKSQELEEKTKGLDRGIDRAVEDAWKRKRDRETRIQALKSAGRSGESSPSSSRVRDFAPRGSMLGHHPFPRSSSGFAEFEDEEDELVDEDETLTNDKAPAFLSQQQQPQLEQDIIKKLLMKVHELEETNTRILKQQQETATQLQAVQRDTEQMNKVYDTLGDSQDIEIEVDEEDCMDLAAFSSNAMRFRDASSTHTPSRSFGKGRHWRPATEDNNYLQPSAHTLERHRSSYSLGSGGLASPALSTLSFLSSPQVDNHDLSPIGPVRTLDAELGNHFGGGGSWGGDSRAGFSHIHTQSLANISQWSGVFSPSPVADPPLPNTFSSVPVVIEPSPLPTPPPATQHLAPHTPEKDGSRLRPSASGSSLRSNSQDGQLHPGTKSPRQVFISQRIRDRRARWEDERFGSISSISSSVWDGPGAAGTRPDPVFVAPASSSLRPKATKKRSASQLRRTLATAKPSGSGTNTPMGTLNLSQPKVPRRITSIVGSLVTQFDGAASSVLDVPRVRNNQRHASPDADSGYEESDEGGDYYDEDGVSDVGLGDSSFETTDYGEEGETEDGDSDDEDDEDDEIDEEADPRTPQIAEENALQLQMSTKPSPRVTFLSSPGTRGSASPKSNNGHQRAASASGTGAVGKGGKWGNILLELWLWLQFAVIIFVFLFAMAKRGPKAVLAEQEGAAGRRTRKTSLHAKRLH